MPGKHAAETADLKADTPGRVKAREMFQRVMVVAELLVQTSDENLNTERRMTGKRPAKTQN